MTHTVREATGSDADGVVRLLDATMLAFDRERARDRVADGDALVAVVGGHGRAEPRPLGDADTPTGGERVVGACVLGDAGGDPTAVEQVAVRRSRRGRGIGTDLLAAAATRTDGPLVVRFRADVRPFYESLGFEIATANAGGDAGGDGDGDGDGPAAGGTDRLRGVLR